MSKTIKLEGQEEILIERSIGNVPLIRAGSAEITAQCERVPEADRYYTAEADPSQQAAVFQARLAPGVVVQGPPGTGKSQTIVNIISDCIGRGERALCPIP